MIKLSHFSWGGKQTQTFDVLSNLLHNRKYFPNITFFKLRLFVLSPLHIRENFNSSHSLLDRALLCFEYGYFL